MKWEWTQTDGRNAKSICNSVWFNINLAYAFIQREFQTVRIFSMADNQGYQVHGSNVITVVGASELAWVITLLLSERTLLSFTQKQND